MQATQNLFSADFSAPKPSACPDVIQLRAGSSPGLETARLRSAENTANQLCHVR